MTAKYQMTLFGEPEQIISPEEVVKRGIPFNPLSPVIVSYGGGRNSTAMLIACALTGVKVDLILFADTGGEKKATYAYLEIFNQWLIQHKMPEITIVRYKAESKSETGKNLVAARHNLFYAFKAYSPDLHWFTWWLSVTAKPPETLEEECLRSQSLPSKAYGQSGCSSKWKIRPQLRYEKTWEKAIAADEAGVPIVKLIGYHAGEIYRTFNKKTNQVRPLLREGYHYDYPLIRWNLSDYECKKIILSVGLPLPPKSSCFFCPSMQIKEILDLDEETRSRAHLIEQCAEDGIYHRDNTSTVGLGRSMSWRDLGKMGELEKTLYDIKRESRQCNCMDGEE